MNKDYDPVNRYVLDGKSFVDTKTNECLNFGLKDLNRITVQLNCLERYLNNADLQIVELQKQLEEKEKEIEDLKRKVNCAVDDLRNIGMRFELETFRANKLQDELKSQPSEIVEKINGEIYTRMVVECKETKYTDINLILNNILKEYQK